MIQLEQYILAHARYLAISRVGTRPQRFVNSNHGREMVMLLTQERKAKHAKNIYTAQSPSLRRCCRLSSAKFA